MVRSLPRSKTVNHPGPIARRLQDATHPSSSRQPNVVARLEGPGSLLDAMVFLSASLCHVLWHHLTGTPGHPILSGSDP